MAPRLSHPGEARVAFEALSIEGGLLGADWLGKVAQLQADAQEPDDYRIPSGLSIRDEIARSWRIAQACFQKMESGRAGGGDPAALVERFVEDFLRNALCFASLTRAQPTTVEDRVYPVRFFALGDQVPVAVAPLGTGLDVPLPELGDEQRRRSAFGLLQETLNVSGAALWGVATDGLSLRIARDNASLTRPAWIEADLGRMFTEDLYPDFAALWLLAHESRFGRAEDPPETCPLEAWREAGREEGTRARDKLSTGFQQALEMLGDGFLSHPANQELRSTLRKGTLTTDEFFGQLLRLVYRLVFLLTVEERGLLHPNDARNSARELYADGYGLRRLRDRAVRRSAHDRQGDLWEAVRIVFRGLAGGEPRLGLPALAGLFGAEECPDLDTAKLENRALLGALFQLAWLREPTGLVRVNWRDMGPDELGYVYEGLLELVPQITGNGRSFFLRERGRKRWPCAEDHRQLLHAGRTGPGAPRHRPRSRHRTHGRRQPRTSRRCTAGPRHRRPRMRLRALPARGGATTGGPRRPAPRGRHARSAGLPTGVARRGAPLHLRRGCQPAGGGDMQSGPLDGVDRSGGYR